MASASAAMKQLGDITECPICNEMFTDPRMLPCIHSYCLGCIQDWTKEGQPGDKVACPLCRKEFVVPMAGVAGLPKNFFIDKLLNIRKLAECENLRCEACASKEKPAKVYCLDCQQNLCEGCEVFHKTLKVCATHKTVDLKDHLSSRDIYTKYPLAGCETHPDKRIELYCFHCKDIICISCYIETHNSHKCSDINKVGEDFRQQIGTDFDKVANGADKCGEILQNLAKYKEDFVHQVCKAQSEISEKAEALKRMIDEHKTKLVDELTVLKEDRSLQIDNLSELVKRHLTTMEGLKKYADEVKTKGTACDIVRAVSGLHERADELLMFDFIEKALQELRHVEVSFTQSGYVVDNPVKTVGDVVVKKADLLLKDLVEGELSDLRLGNIMTSREYESTVLFATDDQETASDLHVSVTDCWSETTAESHAGPCNTVELVHKVQLAKDNTVAEVASAGDSVYILYKTSKDIEVYDAASMTLSNRITIKGLTELQNNYEVDFDLNFAVCLHYSCLYIRVSSFLKRPYINNIYRVKLSSANTVEIKLPSAMPNGYKVQLIVNADMNLVVFGYYGDSGLIQTYSTYGDVLSTVNVKLRNPMTAAIHLSNDRFAVLDTTEFVRLDVVEGESGKILRSCAEFVAVDGKIDYIQEVKHMVALPNDGILVISSDRALYIDRSQFYAREIAIPIEGGFSDVSQIVYDESRDRLCVCKCTGLLLVYDHILSSLQQ